MYGQILGFAWPVIISQLGHVVMGMVDLYFLGQLNSTYLAAGILATQIHFVALVFCMGFSYALTPWIQKYKLQNNVLWKIQTQFAITTGLFFSVLMLIITPLGIFVFSNLQQPQEVIILAKPFLWTLQWSLFPLIIFFSCKQAAEAHGNTTTALWISFLGNGINMLINPVLIFGFLNINGIGYMGSAYATLASRLIMALAFIIALKPFHRHATVTITSLFSFQTVKDYLIPGWYTAWQITFELTAFTAAGLMCGALGKTILDAHGLVLSWASCSFMCAQGISAAGTYYVSGYVAKKEYQQLRVFIRKQILLVLCIMGGFAVLFISLKSYVPFFFTSDAAVAKQAAALMVIAAAFQCFDGLQVTLSGILRGLHDTRWPALLTFIGYWSISIPASYYFGFILKYNALGIWLGLLIGLSFMALSLYFRLRIHINKLKL
jgi:MATE family multidrug resistance protein